MIKTAKVFDDTSGADQVGLYDKVTVYMEDDDETEVYQIVTTMRQDVLKGLISKESPVGRSLLGKRVGDRVHIQVNENYGYDAVIRSILAIHKVLPRQIALSGEKIPRRRAHFQFSNKA